MLPTPKDSSRKDLLFPKLRQFSRTCLFLNLPVAYSIHNGATFQFFFPTKNHTSLREINYHKMCAFMQLRVGSFVSPSLHMHHLLGIFNPLAKEEYKD